MKLFSNYEVVISRFRIIKKIILSFLPPFYFYPVTFEDFLMLLQVLILIQFKTEWNHSRVLHLLSSGMRLLSVSSRIFHLPLILTEHHNTVDTVLQWKPYEATSATDNEENISSAALDFCNNFSLWVLVRIHFQHSLRLKRSCIIFPVALCSSLDYSEYY